MPKLPAVMLYPNDWEGDEIALCSLAAQGLWLRMMFLMHRSSRYGYLSLPNGSAIPANVVAARCGTTEQAYIALLEELDSVGKLSRTSDGVIYSRRMIRDDKERAKSRGKMHEWRKSKKLKNDCNGYVTASVTELLPLSAVALASSLKTNTPAAVPAKFDLPVWIDRDSWEAFEEMRKKKRCPMTDHARKLAVTKLGELREKGHSPKDVLDNSTMNSYQGLFEPSQARGAEKPVRRVYVNAS